MRLTSAAALVLTLAATAAAAVPRHAAAQVRQVAELNTEQIRALDRARTVVILPGGILEEHGPYLPSYSDGYLNERMARELADTIASRPGWTALVFPVIPLGNGPADEVGGHYTFPGSYPVRSTTLRSIYMDLADELGTQGFRWVFVVHGHGAPNHNRMLDQAGDYFRDTYGGHMVHLLGIVPVIFNADSATLPSDRDNGLEIHAGMGETSTLLSMRPDLVAAGYRTAPSFVASDFVGLARVGRQPGWPGYFGIPSKATAERGAISLRQLSRDMRRVALDIVDGRVDERTLPRLGDVTKRDPGNVMIDAAALRFEAATRRRQEAWLRRRHLAPGAR